MGNEIALQTTGSNNTSDNIACPSPKRNDDKVKGQIKFPPDIDNNHECFLVPDGFQPEVHISDYKCTKYPQGHVGFLPMNTLTADDLPVNWMRQEMFGYIKACSAITVRIQSTFISPRRPDGYALHQFRGRTAKRFGTGRLLSKGKRISPCGCKDCGRRPGTVAYEYDVSSANHVIFDLSEAEHAQVEFFLDDGENRAATPAVTLAGDCTHSFNDAKNDVCLFNCITHDEGAKEALDANVDEFWRFQEEMRKERRSPPYHFIISHPHGYPKHVSFGDRKEKLSSYPTPVDVPLYYDTPTCSGSSGAFTLFDFPIEFNQNWNGCVHRGIKDGWNHSCGLF